VAVVRGDGFKHAHLILKTLMLKTDKGYPAWQDILKNIQCWTSVGEQ